MLRKIVKLTQASCYLASQALGYDATDPVVDLNTKNCIYDLCKNVLQVCIFIIMAISREENSTQI